MFFSLPNCCWAGSGYGGGSSSFVHARGCLFTPVSSPQPQSPTGPDSSSKAHDSVNFYIEIKICVNRSTAVIFVKYWVCDSKNRIIIWFLNKKIRTKFLREIVYLTTRNSTPPTYPTDDVLWNHISTTSSRVLTLT